MMRNLTDILASLIVITYSIACSTVNQKNEVKQVQLEEFQMQSSTVVRDLPTVISTTGYQPEIYWFPVKVPTTVLNGLVKNQVYPDPYHGLNNMRIPDASDEFNREYNLEQYSHLPNQPNPWKHPYLFRTTFQVPESDKGRHFDLIFKGINYRAAIWLNGQQIADSTEMAGMFAEYKLNVGDYINAGGENALVVKIYPLDYPGLPSTEQLQALGDFYANGGPTGDIGKNVTMLCSIGWDWIPPVRDRNMGIWQPVFLRTSGPVTIENPQIITELPDLPDTSSADLKLNLTLSNQGHQDQTGQLNIRIGPENFSGPEVTFYREVNIRAGTSQQIRLSPGQVEHLRLSNPQVWWPNGYGKANLYRMKIQYVINDEVSDETSLVFGIRTVSSKTADEEGKLLRRDFYVNGKKVHLAGGAWVPDMMLNRDSLRYVHELRLCQEANVNLVRIWGGGITPPDVFFDLADRYGLLVWSDFWVTGDTQGEFKGSPDWPLETDVFIRNMTSTIYRIRNHPSLLLWTGGNEGHARRELYDAMRDSVIALDGTRPFIPSSSGFAHLPEGWKGSWPDNLPPGVYSGGPYTWNDPREYYRRVDRGQDWVFKDETGLPSQPPYNTLRKIIPDLIWDTSYPFPFNNTWGYHDAATGNGRYDRYYEDMLKRYGEPGSMEEFSEKMQLMNAEGYRGIFEAAAHKINETGGVMLWKLNAAFPSVIWQIYDWYLQPNAGYYFMKNACEPVHIQFNYNDSSIAIVNRTYQPVSGLKAEAKGYDLSGELLFNQSASVDLAAESAKKVIPASGMLSGEEGILFLMLDLQNNQGKILSENVYWLKNDNDFSSLGQMKPARLDIQITRSYMLGDDHAWDLKISNPTPQVAFFIRPQFITNGEELQPSFWSAGYFTLPPEGSMDCNVRVPTYLLEGKDPVIQISGWNVGKVILDVL